MSHEQQPPQHTSREIDRLLQEHLLREDPVNVVTRSLLGHVASEGVAVVRPHEYQQIKETAREVVNEESPKH